MIISPSTNFSLLKDPRLLQVTILTSFLVFGWIYLDWHSSTTIYISALGSCIATQMFWIKIRKLDTSSILSGIISGLGLCLLLRVNSWEWMTLIGIVTISSKFLIRTKRKHVFNPTNFGIIIALLLGVGWVSPGQWGSSMITSIFIVFASITILFGVNRWDVALSFLIGLFILELLRSVLFLGWPLDFIFHKFQNGTVLLFAFFMITDPRTTPNNPKARVLWGLGLSILAFALSQFYYFYQAPLMALFIFSLSVPILDKVFIGRAFVWNNSIKKQNI